MKTSKNKLYGFFSCNQNAFHMAGTKDKRAVTVQFVSTYVEPKRLLSANKQLRNIKLGNIEIHKESGK
jgi:tRNA(Glu) U13 pseudouridine synthase TruD